MKIKLSVLIIASAFPALASAQDGQTSLKQFNQSSTDHNIKHQSQSNVLGLKQQEQNRLNYPIMDEMAEALRQSTPPAQPDERRLWDMYHRGQTAVLQTEISRLEKSFPEWSPPELLTRPKQANITKTAAHARKSNEPHLQLAYFLAQDPNDPGVIFAKKIKQYQTSNSVMPTEKLSQMTESRKDTGVARLFAWNALNHHAFEYAQYWFAQALQWTPDDSDAHYGMALTQFQTGNAEAALNQLATLNTQPAAALRGEIYFSQGLAQYQMGNYVSAEKLFSRSREQGRNGRDLATIQAWLDLRLGHTESALAEFTALYQERPDADIAQGLLTAAQTSGQQDRLTVLMGNNVDDPLRLMVNRDKRDFLLQQGWLLAAKTYDTSNTPELAGIEGPWVGMSLAGTRAKSGDSGLSNLKISQQPSVEGLFVHDNNLFQWRLTQLELNSGALPGNAPFGSYGTTSAYVTQPTTQTSGLVPSIRWRHEGDNTANQITAGTTMLAGPVQATAVVEARHESISPTHNWSASIYRNSVHDSLLSTTGAIDPYSGSAWGRVLRNGIALQASQSIAPKWRANASVRGEQLAGKNVADNTHIGLNLSATYDLGWDGFAYINLGPAFSYDHYQRNLSHFTWGHGGYFSPQRFTNLGIAGQFLTSEGKRFLARGQIGVGLQQIHEASSPCFPIQPAITQPDCGVYAASDKRGLGINLEGLWKYAITPHWHIGGAISVRHSQDYNDTSALLSVYYSWPPRSRLYRADLPEWQLSELY